MLAALGVSVLAVTAIGFAFASSALADDGTPPPDLAAILQWLRALSPLAGLGFVIAAIIKFKQHGHL